MKEKFLKAYMDVADRFAKLSSAQRLQVGAIAVKDDRIISIGYNGMQNTKQSFKVVFTNDISDYEVKFTVRDTEIAQKWFCELCKNYPLYEVDRLSNWNNLDLTEILNNYIAEINDYDDIIDKTLCRDSESLQQDLNYLHKFFEDLRGPIEHGTDWFNNAPANVQVALEKLNVLIHQIEADNRTTNHPTAVVTFRDRPIYKLSESDKKNFTFKWKSGTVYVNYCQIGKTVLDVFKDHDSVAEAIRPQQFYSADFMIKFGPDSSMLQYILRKLHLKYWMYKKGLKFSDPCLGYIPVADIESSVDIDRLTEHTRVKSVECDV